MLTPEAVTVESLGECAFDSPLNLSTTFGDGLANYAPDDARVVTDVEVLPGEDINEALAFEKAGPRRKLFFDPPKTRAAIVTCGGLCPGLNNVIRSLLLQLHHGYRIGGALGIRFGYAGLDPTNGEPPVDLTPAWVEDIHKIGGTALGSSRGPVDLGVAVDFLRDRRVNMLFCIGGDGTQAGALALHEQARRQGYPLAVVGVPKTIDNDINYVNRTFGYQSAVETASWVIRCAHTEAKGAPNGIAVVKLMGRDAGFIAAGAAVASQDVNFALVPEVPFELDGPNGFLAHLQRRIERRKHAVVVVAEGAGQDLIPAESLRRDASGNPLHEDIGPFLVRRIKEHFTSRSIPANVKYIDPSYIIRSVPANGTDAVLCDQMARNAAHAGMAGKTAMIVGYWHDQFTHVPTAAAIATKKRMCPESDLWRGVLASTGQPARMTNQ